MMNRRVIHMTIVCIIIFYSCYPKKVKRSIDKYKLIESSIGRLEVKKSTSLVNVILGKNNLSLSPSWDNNKEKSIEVYIVQPEGLPFNTIAQSIPDDKIIFVSVDWKEQCRETFELMGNDSSATFTTLSLILLHELGHIVNYKPTSIVYGNLDILKLKDSDKMKNEIFADIFSVNSLKNSSTDEAKTLIKQLKYLEEIVRNTYNWRYALHGSPLSMASRSPQNEYGDFSPTHPNLNLRYRIMSYYLEPTKEKLKGINWAIESRSMWNH